MLSGFYTAASGMLMQQRQLNTLAHNMANSQTPGYKGERLVSGSFEEVLVSRREGLFGEPIGSRSYIRSFEGVRLDFDPSFLEPTERDLDLALGGEGFFNIQGDGQVYLTRNGGFTVDEQGYLFLEGVGRVLGKAGPIQVENSHFQVDAKGQVKNEEDRYLDSLLITSPPQLEDLVKQGNGLYGLKGLANNLPAENPSVVQGMLERSNVDVNREMTRLMEVQRSFQATSTIIRGMDRINGLTVTEIGKL